MNVPKQKSGIPQPTRKGKIGADHETERNEEQPQSTVSTARDLPQSKSSQHPLAPAMTKKKMTKKNQISESWADIKTESQSQKMKNQSQTDSFRRKEDIERQLQEAEKQVGALSEIIEKREQMLKDERSDSQRKFHELEDRLIDQEGVLAEHGIDPVTGEKMPVTDDGKKVENKKKITKKTVQEMRHKLQEMNRQTEYFLADIENTMQYLSSLEDASERVGPFSEETQEMIDRIANDEDAINQVYNENEEKAEASEDSGQSDEEVGAKDKKGGGDGSQFFITRYDADEDVLNAKNSQGDAPSTKDIG